MKKTLVFVAIISAVVSSIFTVWAQGALFPDVDESAYYADAVYNLRNRGVISGYQNGKFGPNDPVTRGQVAKMLYKYDQTLVKPEYNVSGIAELIELVCGGTGKSALANDAAKKAYDNICAKLP